MAFRFGISHRSVREELQNREATGAPPQPVRSSKLRSRLQMLLVLVCAVGVFAGARMSRSNAAALPLLAQQIAGIWELQTVNGDPIGPHADSVVLMQRVTFQNGRLRGATRLRADTPAGTTMMPFPDESANNAVTTTDGRYVDVDWTGTYTVLDEKRIELHVGKATYRVEAKISLQNHTLEFDHDAVLTFPGPTHYTASSAPLALGPTP